jgi:hypothetical protein
MVSWRVLLPNGLVNPRRRSHLVLDRDAGIAALPIYVMSAGVSRIPVAIISLPPSPWTGIAKQSPAN